MRELFAGFDVDVVDLADGARPGLDAPLAQEFVAAVGGEPRPKYGWTDVARFSALGIPAVNYGPGDPHLAHHDEERVPLAQIDAVERGLRAWLTGSRPDAPARRAVGDGCPSPLRIGLLYLAARVITTGFLLLAAHCRARLAVRRGRRRSASFVLGLGRAVVLARRR